MAAMPNSGRSLHGCWTCRLRKKKCDEKQPSCSICNSLGLDCTYGSRPEWMNGGVREKEESLRVKRMISETKQKRRRHCLHCMSKHQRSKLAKSSIEEISSYCFPPNMSHEATLPQNALTDHHVSAPEIGPGAFNAFEIYPSGGSLCSGRSLFFQEASAFVGLEDIGSHSLLPASPMTTEGFWQDTYVGPGGEALDHVFGLPTSLPSNSENLSGSYLFPGQSSSAGTNLCGSSEELLIMYYLDEVFHVQYPFYRKARGWLFSVIKRVRSTYHATLALSEYYQFSTISHNISTTSEPGTLRAEYGHYRMALREILSSIAQSHEWDNSTRLIRSIESLTSILQLLFWELFSSDINNWQGHLSAAAALIPALLSPDALARKLMSRTLPSEDDIAMNFLLGSFISLDIISCASTRTNHFLEMDHKVIIEQRGINLEDIIGCTNGSILLIWEISLLDRWKREAEKAHKLSNMELVNRSRKIEERLRDILAHIANTPAATTAGMTSITAQIQITKIFALSAITYLCVVVSGANPELPEIIESVSRAIAAFKELADPKLLRNLVWPFCISGCLAQEIHESTFRDIFSAAEITNSTVGTCLEAFNIIQECWKTRKAGFNSCDWVSTMERRGHYVLLY